MQRNHSAVDVILDIEGPPDVEGKRSQPFFCPGLAPGLFFAVPIARAGEGWVSISKEHIMADDTDPVTLLKHIMERHPQAGSEKWLRIFEAEVIGSPALSRTIRLQAFTAALAALSKSG
jgi:hypothetical protein